MANPCQVLGASSTQRAATVRPASLDQLDALVAAMPPRYRVMTLQAAWCALRFGELTELRGKDVDLEGGVARAPGVALADGAVIVGTPMWQGGRPDVLLPPHLVPLLAEHLGENTAGGRDGLLLPAAGNSTRHLVPATLYRCSTPSGSRRVARALSALVNR